MARVPFTPSELSWHALAEGGQATSQDSGESLAFAT